MWPSFVRPVAWTPRSAGNKRRQDRAAAKINVALNCCAHYSFGVTQRSDIHRPSAIVPGDYEFVVAYQLETIEDGWPVPPINIDVVMDLRASGAKFATVGGLGKCSVCGTPYKTGEVWKHTASGEHIHIGHNCAEKYGLMVDLSAFELQRDRAKRAAKSKARAKLNTTARERFLAEHPGLREALAEGRHSILCDLSARFQAYCELSPKAVELALKIYAEEQGRAAAPAELPPMTVPIERAAKQTFAGVVVSAKSEDGPYGSTQYRWTIKITTPVGYWMAWGTVPSALLQSMPVGDRGRLHELLGKRVKVTAQLRPGRDAHLAIMKRPKAELVA